MKKNGRIIISAVIAVIFILAGLFIVQAALTISPKERVAAVEPKPIDAPPILWTQTEQPIRVVTEFVRVAPVKTTAPLPPPRSPLCRKRHKKKEI